MSTSEIHAVQKNICGLDIDEAKIAINIFANNLALPNKEIRLSTLRILSYYAHLDGQLLTSFEPPHKKLKTEEDGSCSEGSQSINVRVHILLSYITVNNSCIKLICHVINQVIDLLLSVETTPLSLSTSRKIVNLISRLQKGLSSASVNHGYLPLALNGIIGILHNRLSYLWQPASECLAVLLSRYKDIVWDRFVQHIETYQLRVLSSSNQVIRMNPESPQEKSMSHCSFTLYTVGCFFSFFSKLLYLIWYSETY